MEITGNAIAGYAYGVAALVVGIPAFLFGGLLAIAGTSGAVATILFGGVLTVVGVFSLPVSRRVLDSQFGLSFSRGAVVGIVSIGSVLATILFVVAGVGVLLSGGAAEPPGADVSNVTVEGVDSDIQSANALEVTWNSRAQSAVDPDPDDVTSYNSEDGSKYVVIRMQIENVGDDEVDLTPRFFKLQSEGVTHDYQGLFGSADGLSGVTLQPDGTYSGWITFTVPSDMASASLIVDQEAYYDGQVSVEFTHDSEMAIGVDD